MAFWFLTELGTKEMESRVDEYWWLAIIIPVVLLLAFMQAALIRQPKIS